MFLKNGDLFFFMVFDIVDDCVSYFIQKNKPLIYTIFLGFLNIFKGNEIFYPDIFII